MLIIFLTVREIKEAYYKSYEYSSDYLMYFETNFLKTITFINMTPFLINSISLH